MFTEEQKSELRDLFNEILEEWGDDVYEADYASWYLTKFTEELVPQYQEKLANILEKKGRKNDYSSN